MKRFWDKVNKAGPDDCWEWQGSVGSHGYGKFTQGRKWEMTSHRLAHTLTHGEIPKGQVVRHKCDNKRCCNPSHLELGLQKDNVRDMFQRRQGKWKQLTYEQAQHIRELAVTGPRGTGKALAEQYGISRSMVTAIKKGQTWREAFHSGY